MKYKVPILMLLFIFSTMSVAFATPTYFRQNPSSSDDYGGAWVEDVSSSIKSEIASTGCNISCMAMDFKTWGFKTVDSFYDERTGETIAHANADPYVVYKLNNNDTYVSDYYALCKKFGTTFNKIVEFASNATDQTKAQLTDAWLDDGYYPIGRILKPGTTNHYHSILFIYSSLPGPYNINSIQNLNNVYTSEAIGDDKNEINDATELNTKLDGDVVIQAYESNFKIHDPYVGSNSGGPNIYFDDNIYGKGFSILKKLLIINKP